MPYKINTATALTNAEVNRRIRSIRRMLLNKNQVLFYQGKIFPLPLQVFDESLFYSAVEKNKRVFNKASFLSEITSRPQLFDRSNYSLISLSQYIEDNSPEICKSFAVTGMLFVKYRKQRDVLKHAIICTGSIYHAPRVLYRDELSGRVVYEKSIEYMDLY